MSLREIWRAAFASGEARWRAACGALLRRDDADDAELEAAIDTAIEEREARIRAEAYAQGREAGYAAGGRDARVGAPCAGGRHQWDDAAHWCDCKALERY